MVYNTKNYRVPGLGPSSGILNTRKNTVSVSETLCFLVFQNFGRWTKSRNPVILNGVLAKENYMIKYYINYWCGSHPLMRWNVFTSGSPVANILCLSRYIYIYIYIYTFSILHTTWNVLAYLRLKSTAVEITTENMKPTNMNFQWTNEGQTNTRKSLV
jgi:hypothetical protein